MARSNETDAWIQEIPRLRGLKDFEIPALAPKHTQYLHEQHLQCTSKVLPLLQSRLLQSNYEAPSDSLQRSPKTSQARARSHFSNLLPKPVPWYIGTLFYQRTSEFIRTSNHGSTRTRLLSSQRARQSGKKPKIFSIETISSLLLMQARSSH